MTTNEIYELAKQMKKGCYITYNDCKRLLSEQLDSNQYYNFCQRLARILRV